MIIGSDTPKEIGKTYTGFYHNGVFYPDQPLLVLREVTVEEWTGEEDPLEARAMALGDAAHPPGPRLWCYEVSTD